MTGLERPGSPVDRASWIGVAILALFTVTAIAGYWVFALHPNLIPDSDFARTIYGLSFKLFARAHILVAAGALAIYLFRSAGARWLPAFVAVAFASFMSEFIGTGYGFPFSGYEYTSLLGYKLGGRVPFVIPISWFLMALPSWILARAIFSSRKERVERVVLAAYLLTAWDLALDPAMSFLTPYWVWENPGPFYGMPWVNLAGWMGTGIVLMVLLEILGANQWGADLSVGYSAVYYLVVLLMPVGMLAAASVWVPIIVTAAALVVAWLLALGARAIRRTLSRPVAILEEQVG